MQILIVEGDPTARQFVHELVRRLGYHATAVASGRDAMLLLARQSFDIVMSAWDTASMSGPDLFRQTRALSQSEFVYQILMLSHDQLENLEVGLSSGADDYIIKPVDVHLLAVRLRLAERIRRLNESLATQNRLLEETNGTLRSAHKRLNDDFEAAARIQTNLLPGTERSFGRLHLYSSLIPSAVVSGDTYNFFPIGDGALGLYAVDVVGHGVKAALTSFMLSRLIDTESFLGGDGLSALPPDELVGQLNRKFKAPDETAEYFTMICATVTDETLSFCQAGHPSPVLLRRGAPPRLLGEGGFPVGLLPEATYSSEATELRAGDRVVFCSDGVTECDAPDGQLYGERRLQEVLDGSRSLTLAQMIEQLQGDLYDWRGASSFADDVSILALEVAE